MTRTEAYVMALALASTADTDAQRELCTEIAVELALSNDFSFEERLAMRDAAAMVVRTRHPEVDMEYAVRVAIDCYLKPQGTRGGSV
jgi:hypothetical protein